MKIVLKRMSCVSTGDGEEQGYTKHPHTPRAEYGGIENHRG